MRLLFWLALTSAVTVALLPSQAVELRFQLWDKFQHMGAFAVLTTLALLAYQAAPRQLLGERLSFLGAMIEVLQAMPVIHRDCDIWDWVADTLAIILVLAVAALFRRRRSNDRR